MAVSKVEFTNRLPHFYSHMVYLKIHWHLLGEIDSIFFFMMLEHCTIAIAELVKRFFNEVWQTPNQLLRTVFTDIQVPEYVAGCKAFGLINKIITGPLWRVLECNDVSILDMNERYQQLKFCLDEWACDAMVFYLEKPFFIVIFLLLKMRFLAH